MIKLFESFTPIEDVKNDIFLEAISTEDVDIIDFFLEKGYDINGDSVFLNVIRKNDKILRYFLEKGIEPEHDRDNYYLKKLDVQKALIDFGHEFFIYDGVGFNSGLSNDPKYADVIEMVKNMKKYNI